MGSVCTGIVVFHRSMVNWRRGWGQSVMKLIHCSGLPEIYGQLGVSLPKVSVHYAICETYVV